MASPTDRAQAMSPPAAPSSEGQPRSPAQPLMKHDQVNRALVGGTGERNTVALTVLGLGFFFGGLTNTTAIHNMSSMCT